MPHTSKTLIASIFAAALAVAPAVIDAKSTSPAASTPASRITIDNFGQISPSYFRGSQPEGDDYANLAKLGVKTVIDLQADGEDGEAALVKAAGMTYVRIPMTTRVEPTKEQLAQFLKLVNDPASQPVYVHCAGGRHRTGVMTAVYRITHDGWSGEQAFKEMKSYKFGADFLHPEFKRFVYGYKAEPAPASPLLAISTPAVAN